MSDTDRNIDAKIDQFHEAADMLRERANTIVVEAASAAAKRLREAADKIDQAVAEITAAETPPPEA
jgi:hypothetical protein